MIIHRCIPEGFCNLELRVQFYDYNPNNMLLWMGMRLSCRGWWSIQNMCVLFLCRLSKIAYCQEKQILAKSPYRCYPVKEQPIKMNGAIYVWCVILKFIIPTAAEACIGALFLNIKKGKITRVLHQDLGNMQLTIPIRYGNAIAAGITNNSIKKQHSRSK